MKRRVTKLGGHKPGEVYITWTDAELESIVRQAAAELQRLGWSAWNLPPEMSDTGMWTIETDDAPARVVRAVVRAVERAVYARRRGNPA
jgi:hypothetical protein